MSYNEKRTRAVEKLGADIAYPTLYYNSTPNYEVSMSNHIPPTPPDQPDETALGDSSREVATPVDLSRRRLTGAGLGVSAIFTLASRPVWANQCTLSGMMSGNLSAPKGLACMGCTPGYWSKCQHLASWAVTGYSPSDEFNTVFGVTQYVDSQQQPYTLLEVLGLIGEGDCTRDPEQPKCNKAGPAIGKIGCDPISVNLGFHAVAALLNAAHPDVNYGYTGGELINLFKNNLGNPSVLKNDLDKMNNRGCPLS